MRRASPVLPAAVVAVLALALAGAPGCGTKKAETSAPQMLTAEATYRRGMELLSRRELRQATSLLKTIQFSPDMREELEPLARLALADATFHQASPLSLIDARNLYLDFVTLNGDHPLAPYAQLQVGMCSLKQVNHPSKDQYETHQAILDLRQVGERWPDSPYVEAAESLLRQAVANLAESEFLVGRFYVKRKAYGAAVERFRNIVETYPEYAEMEKVLFHLGQTYLKSGNTAEGRIYLDKVLRDYPEGDYVGAARKALGDAGTTLEAELGSF